VQDTLQRANQAAQVRYYLENRRAEFEQKMAKVLCIYREVEVLKKAPAKSTRQGKRVAHPLLR
jgi:hypothetical protein